ncbi:hypothetical protein Sjap_020811 [Stephania japonica]|uniref:Uncharacterized protein n=1 Tax=Stephania japonica TaxID=461633 RepID=A0AAP0HZB5_9MAGN
MIAPPLSLGLPSLLTISTLHLRLSIDLLYPHRSLHHACLAVSSKLAFKGSWKCVRMGCEVGTVRATEGATTMR